MRATLYLPEPQGAYPVLIYFHGGSFTFGNREQGLEQVLKEKLLANNIAIVSADYRLAPETKLGEIMQESGIQYLTGSFYFYKSNSTGRSYAVTAQRNAAAHLQQRLFLLPGTTIYKYNPCKIRRFALSITLCSSEAR
ncbi:alpha/beta hydrolase [Alistipes indistinctus]|uniref:alpha/beta hydrolase n=1 Tax=Alistipes indistinctus TaxID=626932 RepID=UPI0039F520FA